MSENISVLSDSFKATSLLDLIKGIPAPESYFKGRQSTPVNLPQNLLLFTRNNGEHLNSHRERHFHNRHLLLIPLRGQGRVIVNAHAYEVREGTALYIKPYQFHHYSGISEGEIAWIYITFEQASPEFYDEQPLRRLTSPESREDLRALVATYLKPGGARLNRELSLRLALLLNHLRAESAGVPLSPASHDGGEALVLAIHHYLAENLRTPPTLSELAVHFHLSESHLRKTFHHATGISLGQFQRRFRLQRAAELLQKGNMTVMETAMACGWESPFSFSRAFTQYWGFPPKTFRKSRGK